MQHYLLSAQARTLSVAKVARLSDDAAYALFKDIRWSENDSNPVCPKCGHKHCWSFKTRKIYKCKNCEKQFSITSGTVFANRKLPIKDYLLAIAIFVNAHKGLSALQLGRDLGVQYKTAFVMAHKIRESLGADIQKIKLTGEVEVDGAYFGGYVKPSNWKENRRDRRLAKNQNGKRRCVFVIREREGRTVPVIIKSENTDAIETAMLKHISRDALIHADENPAYDAIHGLYQMERINHSVCYSSPSSCTNNAESWFSRLRRAELGQHHKMAGKYLHAYANEMAHREDYRREDNGTVFEDVLKRCLKSKASSDWSGYWQGNNQIGELLAHPN